VRAAYLLLVFLVACSSSTKAPTPDKPVPPPSGNAPGEETFTGTITEANFGCAVDASCDLVVDKTKRVHFGHDTRREGPVEWGNTEQVFELMEQPDHGVGKRVEVYAAKNGAGYTLQGKSTFYIKVLP
jgi:hypothetical protein